MSDLLRMMLKESFDKIEEYSPPYYPTQMPMMQPMPYPPPMGYGYPPFKPKKKDKDDDEDDDKKKKKGDNNWLKYLLAAGAAAGAAGGGAYMLARRPQEPSALQQGLGFVKDQVMQQDVLDRLHRGGEYLQYKFPNLVNDNMAQKANSILSFLQPLLGGKPTAAPQPPTQQPNPNQPPAPPQQPNPPTPPPTPTT